MKTSDQHLLDKLSFWHKLEFFIPRDPERRSPALRRRRGFGRVAKALARDHE